MALLQKTPSTAASAAHEQTTAAPPIVYESFWQQLYAAAVFAALFILTCCGLYPARPSAAGAGYDAANSSGTNLGPLSDKLLSGMHVSTKDDGTPNPAADFDGMQDLVAAYRQENGLADNATVPADAVTRSASGLDPHISRENALLQAERVAKARGISDQQVHKLVAQHTDARSLGLLGEPGVNVLRLNLALDKAAPVAAPPATAPR